MHHDKHSGKHYVCHGGCNGVSDKAGTCQAADCASHGKALEECDCHEKNKEDVIIDNS